VPRPSNSAQSRFRRAALALAALSVCCAVTAIRGATSFASDATSFASDANRAHTFLVGQSPGLANCEGLDASSSNRSRLRFPRAPEVAFRVRLAGGIGQAPASDAAGNLIVVHGEPRLSKLDEQGRTLWTKRLESELTSAPVLRSDGSILLVSHDADALLLAPSGKLLHQSSLPFGEPHRRTLTIPLTNGGVLVASGTDIVELDDAGAVARQNHSQASITGIAQWGSALVAIGENGAVALARVSGDFETIGNLGGAAPDGGAVQDGKIFAIIDGHKLVAFDLKRRSAVTLASDPAISLSGPLVLFENQSLALVADGGLVSLHAASGAETLRVSIAEAGRAFDPAARALRPALLSGDSAGAVAATRAGSDALILEPDGKALRFEDTRCLDPFRPTPTRLGVVFACRSGQIFGVSDKAP
jgi:PQQ-like domain